MRMHSSPTRRKGSVLVEYALLIAGVALTCVLAIAVLGHKTQYSFGIAADIMPGASANDNQPIHEVSTMPLDTKHGPLKLDSSKLVSEGGTDRLQDIFGAGAGNQLIVDHD